MLQTLSEGFVEQELKVSKLKTLNELFALLAQEYPDKAAQNGASIAKSFAGQTKPLNLLKR